MEFRAWRERPEAEVTGFCSLTAVSHCSVRQGECSCSVGPEQCQQALPGGRAHAHKLWRSRSFRLPSCGWPACHGCTGTVVVHEFHQCNDVADINNLREIRFDSWLQSFQGSVRSPWLPDCGPVVRQATTEGAG